jgi:hypothetical protein
MKTVEQKGRAFFDGLRNKEFHFFASSVATWVTTTDNRTLPDVIELMEGESYIYSLFLVPGAWDSNYEIRHYAPQVEGAMILGTFTPKKHIARKSA